VWVCVCVCARARVVWCVYTHTHTHTESEEEAARSYTQALERAILGGHAQVQMCPLEGTNVSSRRYKCVL
jgi:hypothetical protein